MQRHLGSHWKTALALALGLLALAALCGCPFSPDPDPDPNPCPNPPCDGGGASRETPVKLLTDYFEKAYSERDSILYAAMLDDQFQFEFLQADADSLRLQGILTGTDNFWGRTSDLLSTGSLFRNEAVTGITLNLLVNSNNEYLGSDCTGCRELETTVTLRVSTIGDGTEPLIFTVDSPQTFVCKLDLSDSLWVLFRQKDRPRS